MQKLGENMMRKNWLIISIYFLGSFCFAQGQAPGSNTVTGVIAPYLLESKPPVKYSTTITTAKGEKIGVLRTKNGLVFEGYENRIVLLEVYGYSCPHCKDAIPDYNAVKNKYPNDVYVITLENYGLNNIELQNYVRQYGIQYDTVATENSGKLLQYFVELGGPIMGVPNLLVFRRDGTVEKYFPLLGNFPKQEIDNLIQSLL